MRRIFETPTIPNPMQTQSLGNNDIGYNINSQLALLEARLLTIRDVHPLDVVGNTQSFSMLLYSL